MKRLKIALMALLTIGAFSFGQAQSKIAHISTQDLLTAMPEYQKAMSDLKSLSDSYDADLKDMYKELEEKRKKYGDAANSLSDAENQKNVEDYQETQKRIAKYQQNAEDQIQQKQKEALTPILDKVKNAIEKVAKQKGFDYVFNYNENQGPLIVADGYDLLPDVKKELGIQ